MLKDKRTVMVGTLVLALFLLSLTLTNPGKALAVDAFLKVDGVDGESTDKDHKNWIPVINWSFGNSAPLDPQTSSRTGKFKMQDFKFTKRTDKASPTLFGAVASGKHYPKVELSVNKSGSGGAQFLKIELKNSSISSFVSLGSSGAGGSEAYPMEEIMLNFDNIKFTYTEFDARGAKKGTIEVSVDVQSNIKP
jgi:type VI secretion system secreted protein Hcp